MEYPILEAWKDSFDRLLDRRPALRELNIIKQNVNASYNVDSSVENSVPLIVIDNNHDNDNAPTPTDLFQCPISPISEWKFYLLDKDVPTSVTQAKRHVGFALSSSPMPGNGLIQNGDNDVMLPQKRAKSLVLHSGKWRKSLRRLTTVLRAAELSETANSSNRFSVRGRKSIYVRNAKKCITTTDNYYVTQVLDRCDQERPLPFGEVYSDDKLGNCKKIGEGVYGEVFLANLRRYRMRGEQTVLKVIPIEGNADIVGEAQKTYEQILPEIVITVELSKLQLMPPDARHSTTGFVGIEKISIVQGQYPDHLLKLWEDYDSEKGSENEHPKAFPSAQLFVVMELQFSGTDMESFSFLNAEQAYFTLHQVVFTLAVAEEAYQFEHRDLHWGNILIHPTRKKTLKYKINGNNVSIATKGIKATIIDYTLSRMIFDNTCMYNDLSNDEELFCASGDYQFDIYRKMRHVLNNDWAKYEPKTNVFWISYVNSKMIDGVSYRNPNTKKHAIFLKKLGELQDVILESTSAAHFANHLTHLTN